MNFEDDLRKLVETAGPKNYARAVTRNAVLYQEITRRTADLPEQVGVPSRIYTVLNPGNPVICERGKIRRWINITEGFGYCGRGKVCECFMQEIGHKVRLTRQTHTPEDKAEANRRREITVLKKYGTRNVSAAKSVNDKRTATMLARHGRTSMLSDIEAREGGMIARYGKANPGQVAEIRARTEETNLQRYGYAVASKANSVREKLSSLRVSRNDDMYGSLEQRRENFIRDAQEIHSAYGYDSVEYKGMVDKVKILCGSHGIFEQLPYAHLAGQGCPRCAVEKRGHTRESYLTMVSDIHKQRYDYTDTQYGGIFGTITVLCPEHSYFTVNAHYHQQGQGCPECSSNKSRAEDEIVEFIVGLIGEDRVKRHQKIFDDRRDVDILIPDLKIAIEHHGLYWHSNAPKKAYPQQDKHWMNKHLDKHLACEAKGFRLISIFEDEWINQKSIVKSTLRHFLGKSPRGIFARKARIEQIDWNRAKPFLQEHHLLGAGRPGNIQIGALDGDQLIACMTFGSPSDERGKTELIEMKRFVTDGRNHPGLGSRMFRWAVREYQFNQVVAFVDRRWFTGEFKSISGFVMDGATVPAMFWTNFRQRYHRRSFNKQELQEQLGEMNQTKSEMMRTLGYHKIWDCGKHRLMWSSE